MLEPVVGKLKLDTAGLARPPMAPGTEEADKDGKGGGKLASARPCLGGRAHSFAFSIEKEEAAAQRDTSPLSKMMITIPMIYRC